MSVRSESSSHSEAGLVLLTLAVGLGLLTASWGALHLPPFDRYQIIDTPVYQEYGEAMAAGEVPYRDFDLEYPPGALPVFWLPTLGPAEHYGSIFRGAHVDLRGGTARARRSQRRGARGLACAPARSRGRGRALPARARDGRAHPLRPLAGGPDRRRARRGPRGPRAPRPRRARHRRRREDLSAGAPSSPPGLRGAKAGREGGGDRLRRLRGRAGSRRAAVRGDRAGGPRGLGAAPARPAAPDREPRRLAPARGPPARALRADRRLLVRLPEPHRLAPGRARRRPDPAPGGGARRRVDPLRARSGDSHAARRRVRRLGRGLRRPREGALAAVPDLARPRRRPGRRDGPASRPGPSSGPPSSRRTSGSRRATGTWSTSSPWAGSRSSATFSSSRLPVVLAAVATARARAAARSE